MDHSLGPTFEWTKQDSSLDSHHSTLVSSHYHEELAKQWPFGVDQNPLQQTQSHSYTSIVTPADLETTVGNEKEEFRDGRGILMQAITLTLIVQFRILTMSWMPFK
jgi:hypothetical protein